MKQQAWIRLKTTSLLNIPSTYIYSNPPPLFPGETALQLQRVPSGNEMHLFILIPPQHFRCTINAQQATQWGMRGRHKNSDMHVCMCGCDMRVWASARQSLITFRTQRHKNNERKWWWRRWAGQCPILPTPTLWLHLFAISLLLLLLLMTPRGGQRMNNKPPQTWNALKIHNFQIIFNDFKYTWVEPVAPRQMDHEQRPGAYVEGE